MNFLIRSATDSRALAVLKPPKAETLVRLSPPEVYDRTYIKQHTIRELLF